MLAVSVVIDSPASGSAAVTVTVTGAFSFTLAVGGEATIGWWSTVS